MKRSLIVLLALTLSLSCLSARTYREGPELVKVFKDQGVSGTFVLFDIATDTMFVSDQARARKRFTPASTFKIANSLIGLDVSTVKSVDEVLPYGGKPQRIKEWERDMGLREAIRMSNVAIYQELARRIGLDRMREGVKKLGYGNMEIGEVVDRFWLVGSAGYLGGGANGVSPSAG
jgi:beta-lactamase class D